MKKLCFSFSIFLLLVTFSITVQAQIPTSGLRLHLKADAGTSTTTPGQKISQWSDQTGNGFHAIEANPTWQPMYVNDGGIPAVRFTPSAPTSMNLPKPSDMGFYLSDYEFFIVTKTSSSATQFPLAGGINFHEIQLSGGGARYIARLNNLVDNTATVDDGAFHVINAIGTTTEAKLGVDGAYATLSTDATTSVDVALHLGTRADGFYRFDGDIAEILVYNRKLTATESMQVSEYLQAKYSTSFTAYAAPGSPASNVGFSSVTQNSMNISLSKGTGSHRIIIARRGGAVTAVPSNGVLYSGNAAFGSGHDFGNGNYAVYVGTEGTSTALGNLAFNSDYHFAVYEYNIVGGFAEYLSTSATASQTTSDLTPASNLQIIGRTANTFSGSVTAGSGTHRLIVARQGSAVNQGPTDGVDYTGNTAFGSGNQIGTGNYVIYAGTDGTSYSMSSLSNSTVYHLAVFEYLYVDGVPLYRTSSPTTDSDITFPATPASSVQFSGTGLNEMTVSFTPGNGNKRIVIAREAAAVSVPPTNGQSYSASSVFETGSDLGSGNYVVYAGTGSSVNLSGLDNSTTYYFAVYEYSEHAGVTSYLTTSPAVGSNSTTVVPFPTITEATFGKGTATSRKISGLINPNGYETSVEIIYGTDTGNLNSTTASHSVGSGIVNVADTVDVTGLNTGQTYYAKIRATNIRGSVESDIITLVPMTLTSIQGWFRGDVVKFQAQGSAEIDEWLDLSGSGNDLIDKDYSSEVAHPILQSPTGVNGNPATIVDGNNFFKFNPSYLNILNTDLELFIVFKTSINSNDRQEILRHSLWGGIIELNSNSGVYASMSGSSYATSGSVGDYSEGNGHIIHYKTANNRFQLRVDDGEVSSSSVNNRIIHAGLISLGGVPSSGISFDGQIAEILFYNAELSVQQRQEIAEYLSDRYEISMFVPSVPETAASSLNFTNVGATNLDVSFTKGDGERRIVVARLNGSTKTVPTANIIYSANANFGSGSNLGNDNYVVYDGTGNSVAVTGLAANSEYTIDVYEYNIMELDPQYLLSSPNSASQSTQTVPLPSANLFNAVNLNANSATIQSLVNPNGFATTVQVFYGTSSSTLNSSTTPQNIGDQSATQTVNTSLSGLTSGVLYYYKVSATNVAGTVSTDTGSFVFESDISLPSLQFWVAGDGATYTANSGDPVSSWGNQAGKAIKAYQDLAQYSPSRITDSGLSFLRFDGNTGVKFLEMGFADSLGLLNSDYEIFMVARSSSSNIGFLMGGAVGNFEIHTRPGGGVGTRFIPKSGLYVDNPVNSTDGDFHIFNAKTTSTQAMLRIDGNSTFVNQDARSGVVSELLMGARRDGTPAYNFDGDIAEVLIYNSALTDIQRKEIEHYLAGKYSVELPYYFVNSTSDIDTGSGQSGTLRYVLNAINSAAPDSSVIVDMSTITGTITLTSDLPPINYNTTINGPGKENLTISGNNLYRPFFIGAGIAPFTGTEPAAPSITLSNFTIINGLGKGGNGGVGGGGGGAGMGGAIFINAGFVEIVGVAFNNNQAIGGVGDNGNSGGIGGAFGIGGSGGLLGTEANGGAVNGYPGGFGAGGGSVYSGVIPGGNGGFGGGGGGGGYARSGGAGGFGAGYGIGHFGGGGGGGGFGGAIFNRNGDLLIRDSEFNGNTATGGSGTVAGTSYGGAIFNYNGKILSPNNSFGTNNAVNEGNFYNLNQAGSNLEIITLLPPTNVMSSTATINATINTLGRAGTYVIKYGNNSSNLTETTSATNYTGEPETLSLSVALSELTLSEMLYYQVAITDEYGTIESTISNIVFDTSIPSDSLQLWVSADRGLELSETKLATWYDASGSSNTLTQSASANRPTLVDSVINDKPVIRFNGSTSFLTLPSADDLGIQNSDYELFIIAKSSSSELQFLYSGAGETYEFHLNGGVGARLIPTSGIYIDAGSSSEYANGQAYIFNSHTSSASGGLRINDELKNFVGSNTQSPSDEAINLGRRYDGTYHFNGDIAEIIIYNKTLSSSDRETVVDYLANKYEIEKVVITEPTAAASQPVLSQVSINSLGFSITKGNGAKRIVVAKQGSAVDASPANDQTYTANAAYGSGTELGTGNFVVYNGSDSTFTVTGLSAGVEYYFSVFEYNGTAEAKYLTSSVLTFSKRTLSDIPEGLPGSAITFGGSDEDIMVPHTPEFNSAAVTMEIWFKSDDSGTDYDFLTSKASEELEIHLGASGVANTIRFIPASQVYIDSPVGAFTAGEWTHLAVVYDPSQALAKMYINGEEVQITNNGTNPLTTPRNQTTNPFYMGSRAGSALHYNGSMDEVRIWKVARTGDEIREFMHRSIQSDYQNMIAYWQFNEGSGTSLADNISGLDGTLQGFEFNASNGWEDSEVAFGSGSFTSVGEVTTGTQALSSLSFALTEDFDNAVILTSDYVNAIPNDVPEIELVLEDSYWIVKAYGGAGDFEATLTFTVPTSMISKGSAENSQFKLYRRPSNGAGSWTVVKQEASAFTSNTVSFTGVSELGQFTVGREINIEYAQSAGSAIKFDGVNDYISVSDNDLFDVTKYTLELWFKWNEGANNVEFITGKNLQEFEIHTIGTANSIRFIPTPNVYIDSPDNAFVSNTWTHLTVLYDPSQSLAKMYVNGIEVTVSITGNLSTAIVHSSNPFVFGTRSGGGTYYFNGELDEIRLWKAVRTQAEIQQDMNGTTPNGYNPDLVAYWQFNEGTGTTTVEQTNHLTGTLNSFDFNENSGWTVSTAPIENREIASTTLTGTEGWRLLASPIQDSTLSPLLRNLWTQGFTGAKVTSGNPNVFTWSTANATSDNTNWSPLTNIANSPQPGSGLLVYVFSDDNYTEEGNAGFPKTLQVEGLEPDGDQTLTSLLNTNKNGFTLLGNPFKKDIDWDLVTKDSLSEVVYVYDNNSSGWKSWNGFLGELTDGKVGAFNGFFVQTIGSDPSLVIPTNAKEDSAKQFLGKEMAEADPFFFSLELQSDSGLSNNAWFQFSESGSEKLDAFDAHQLVPLSSSYVLLGSQIGDGTSLAINNLPKAQGKYEFPLVLSTTESGKHQISVNQISLPEGWEIKLIDKQTGLVSNLEEPYIFTMKATIPKAKLSVLTAPTVQVMAKAKSNSRFMLTVSSTGFEEISSLPETIELQQNYPNPFNPSSFIQFGVPKTSKVNLDVFDLLGRKVATLINGESKTAGRYSVQFDGRNMASGLYIYRLQVGNTILTKKMTLIK